MALQGLAGGDVKAAIAGGAAPYLAEAIKVAAGDNEAARVIAHAVVAGVVAEMQGKSAAAGAAGAGIAALAGEAIKNVLYGDTPVDQLTEQQKQTLVGLGTLVAGFAGGLAGDSTASAMAGAQAGQNELSNNMASIGMLQQMMAQQTLNAAAMAEAGSTNPNDAAALALTKAVKQGLGASCLASDVCLLLAVVAAQSQPKHRVILVVIRLQISPRRTRGEISRLTRTSVILVTISRQIRGQRIPVILMAHRMRAGILQRRRLQSRIRMIWLIHQRIVNMFLAPNMPLEAGEPQWI